MTANTSSREPPAGGRRPSFADLIAAIQAMAEFKPRDRDDILSALRTICRALGKTPEELLADVTVMQALLKGLTAAAVGLKPSRWSNVKSLTLKALLLAKVATMPVRHRDPLAPALLALYSLLTSKKAKAGLSRFFRWLSTEGISPDAVTDQTLAAFLEAMLTGSLMARPYAVQRVAAQEWNKAAAAYPTWPQRRLIVPNNRDTYNLSWEAFPLSLKTEFFDGYLHRVQGGSLFSDYCGKPLRPVTISNQKCQFLEFISAFVRAGGDAATLTCLKDVVALPVTERAMEWLLARNHGKISHQMNHIAGLVRAIARHWVKVPKTHLDTLDHLCKNTKQTRRGMASSVRAMLRPFDNDDNVMRILNLPQEIERLVKDAKPSVRTALLMQTAVAIEILVMDPARIKTLSALRFGVHLIRRHDGTMHLIIEEEETKNGETNEVMLPDQTVRLIDLYKLRYRPLLTVPKSDAVFPGPGTATKYRKTLSEQISKHILEITGLRLTPHKFRHFMAKHYLAANPGGIGTVQRALGHRHAGVTNKSYVDFQNGAAIRHIDEHVLRKREEAPRILKRAPKMPKSLMTTKAPKATEVADVLKAPPSHDGSSQKGMET